MRISLFLEIGVPRPWDSDTELRVFHEHLDLVELADKVGFHGVWVTEHHFLEEYSHASAPEVFLAALSQRTKKIRLGHGIVQMPPLINHPARVAERVSTLDLVSSGRVEFGVGEGSSVTELGGFVIDPGKKRAMWHEAMAVAIGCMADTPFAGFEGEFVKMPPRNVVPKPAQKPHPPIWLAATQRETVAVAARAGLGCLSFSLREPELFEGLLREYYSILESDEMVPLGRTVNANVLSTVGHMICADSEEQGIKIMANGARWFGYGIGHYYLGGPHKPGATNLWEVYTRDLEAGSVPGSHERDFGMVGSPDKLREALRGYERAGADEVMFIVPPVKHEDLMESFERFGQEVLPEFAERDVELSAKKAKRLEPIIERAMARRPADPVVDPEYVISGVPTSWEDNTTVPEIAFLAKRAETMAQG